MEKSERIYFIILIIIALSFNIITLTPLIPWQKWLLWSHPVPDKSIFVDTKDYEFKLPSNPILVKKDEIIEFVVTSQDVTYGFGVFRKDGTLVFQMQILPGYKNKILWKFETPGRYDIRSTEYSGPGHSGMFLKEAIIVVD